MTETQTEEPQQDVTEPREITPKEALEHSIKMYHTIGYLVERARIRTKNDKVKNHRRLMKKEAVEFIKVILDRLGQDYNSILAEEQANDSK